MGKDNYSHEVPSDFKDRVVQYLAQQHSKVDLADAFAHCIYHVENLGNAYQNAHMRGDNWNMDALDITIEGPKPYIDTLKHNTDVVKSAMSKALKRGESGLLVHDVFCLSVGNGTSLPTTDAARLCAEIEGANNFLADIIDIGSRLCANVYYGPTSTENSINDYIRDQLQAMGYSESKDQTRHGRSLTGKDAGEVDLLITKGGKEVAIIEALKLSGINRKYIEEHLEKAIRCYNTLGTATFIITYFCSADFASWWTKYLTFLETNPVHLEMKVALHDHAAPNASTRVASMTVLRDGFEFPVYFVAFHLV